MTPTSLAGGRYVLERELGIGGMAVVMLARDTVLDRPVAVKLLDDRLGRDGELRERFLREGRFSAQLSHPNVVAVYDTGEEDTQPYIVMECVEGVSLAEELSRRGRLPPKDVIELGRQACAGLDHAHSRSLVHRDVKPQNLLLREDGLLKVADFGIARLGDGATTMTQAGTLLGTAAYMAPEVVHGEPATAAADIYSLGAVLYELLTGRPPQGTTLAELANREPPARPSESVRDVPPHLESAVMRCLEADPARRPESATALARDLDVPTAERTLSERPTEVVRRTERTRLGRGLWAVAGGVLAALVLGLALTFGGGDPAPPAQIEPVPAGGSAAEDARNLADWLRENAG